MMTANISTAIGGRVKGIRKRKGLTQTALAKAAGVDQKTISNLELSGQDFKTIRLDSLERIAKALGLELWQLLIPQQDNELFDLLEIINYYNKATPTGKESLKRIATLEARHGAE